MADQKKWFKVWTTLLIDSLSTKIDDIGRFTVLGCLIASRGENGKLVTDKKSLQMLLQCDEIPQRFIKSFNIVLEEIEDIGNGNISVTFKNWNKFQIDSTGYDRQQRYREGHSVTAKVTAKVTAQDKIRVDKIRVDKIRDIYPSEFMSFYEKYPKKIAKPKALQVWLKLSPTNGTVEAILSGLSKWKLSPDWTKDNGQFIPHPATWLNQRRWEDEIPVPPNGHPKKENKDDMLKVMKEWENKNKGEHAKQS